MNDFTKTVRIGTAKTYGGRGMSIYCRIKFDDGRLSISGVEGPLPSGNCLGGCGQIDMHLAPDQIVSYAPEWNTQTLRKFLAVWKEWHLNDMKAGTPAQETELKKHEFPGYPESHYTWACEILEKAGLHPDNGYKYGSAWLSVDVPSDVIEFLQSLPDTDKTPAWV